MIEARWLTLLIAIFGGSLCKLARGQPGVPCSGPDVTLVVPDAEHDQWQTLRSKLSDHLRTLPDRDRCAQLTLHVRGTALVVEVRASDGRVAARTVTTEAEVMRVSEALLTLPPQARTAVAPAAEPPPAARELPEAPDRRPAAPKPAPRVELGVGVAARLGGSPLFVAGGIAGFADAAIAPWLIGVSARWELTTGLLTQPTLMDYYLMSTAVGVHVGRRYELESTSLDLLLGPNLVIEAQDADDGNQDIGGSSADVRVDLGARLSGPKRSRWRAFGSTDLELSPARLAKDHYAHPGLPALPSFSFGVVFGVLWSGT